MLDKYNRTQNNKYYICSLLSIMVIIYCPDQPNYKGKGAGLYSDIKSDDLSSDFTFYSPGHWTYSCAISTQRRAYIPAAISAH